MGEEGGGAGYGLVFLRGRRVPERVLTGGGIWATGVDLGWERRGPGRDNREGVRGLGRVCAA